MQNFSQTFTTNKPTPSFLQAECPSCRQMMQDNDCKLAKDVGKQYTVNNVLTRFYHVERVEGESMSANEKSFLLDVLYHNVTISC